MKLIKIVEGDVKLWIPDLKEYKLDSKMPVFFNPVMKLNRDIAVQVAKTMKRPRVLDLLAGTGAKGLRLCVEAKANVDFNDANPSAVKLIKRNAKLNKVDVEVFNESANKLLRKSRRTYDFIDIDPFGTPVDFLKSSITRLRSGGILAVTATDTSALVGTYPKACMRKYGSKNIKTKFMFEIGTRILIKKVVEEGIKLGVSLEPVFVHSSNHYLRVYLKRVKKSLSTIKKKVRPVFYCADCTNFKMSDIFTKSKKRCSCSSYFEQLGPMWIGRLWDKELVNKIELADISPKSTEFIKSEAMIDSFGYFDYHSIAKKKNVGSLPKVDELIEQIKKKGYKATRTHFSPTGIRSDIPSRNFLKLLTT